MIRHIVCWKFKDEAEGRTKQENMDLIAGKLRALMGVVPSLISLDVGKNVIPGDMAYDMGLVCTFKDIEGLEAYRVHPKHQEISQYVGKVNASRVTVDFES